MIINKITIINKLGLHARASAKLVSLTSRFASHIEIRKDKQSINGKSIMGVMMLAAAKGTELELVIEGPDEDALCEAVCSLFNNCFDEEQ